MELISCPSCGQKQSDQNGTCISCGAALACAAPGGSTTSHRQPADASRKCPYCGAIQGGGRTTCVKCGKSMKQPFRIPIWVFVFLALDLILIFTMAALLKAGEMAGIISLFPISGLTIGVYGGLSGALMRRGKFIIPKEIEQKPITEFPRLALTDLTGLTIDREVVILLDEPAQQLIFTTWGWKRILSFDQVVDVNLHTETIVRKKDPAMATAIGAAMGGTTGAMIGLAVGMTDDVERKERFELLYHPKEAHWETASISGTARKNSSMSAPAFVRKTRIALGLDKPDSPPTPIQKRGSL